MITNIMQDHNQHSWTLTKLVGGVWFSLTLALVFLSGCGQEASQSRGRISNAKVEHVRSGQKIKLKSGDSLMYAGIRTPVKNEPLYEEALKLNKELVEEKKIRMRFDGVDNRKDKKGRWVAFVFAESVFVNERLVKEGLAYVRLTTTTMRFSKELLKAQDHARKNKLGIWKGKRTPVEPEYHADSKYGNFHRPTCEEVEKIQTARLVHLGRRQEAFDKGFAPCTKCNP